MNTTFKIVVPVRNAQGWITKCIESIASQDYLGKWECLVVDDASTDETVERIKDAIESIQSESIRSKFKVKFNAKRVGALQNFIFGFKSLGSESEPESVLIQIDGDDWLFSHLTLQIVNEAYNQTGCWMTWGNYIEWPIGVLGMAKPMPADWHKNSDYRSRPWIMSHLRTFKSHLWHSIDDKDLRDSDGNYYDVTWDLAHMYPMIEMAQERSCFIPYVLYSYNRNNPLSDDKIYRERQLKFEKEIRSKVKYNRKIK